MQISGLRIGTRGSRLAMVQAGEAQSRLAEALGIPPSTIEIVPLVTTGDRITDRSLSEIGGKGLFTKEIEEALLAGAIDIAVHSMKDLPAALPDGLMIAAVLPREDARDAFLSPIAKTIADLPRAARVGSSSVRRTAQLLRLRPDLIFTAFRGNVDTRLRKLKSREVDATLLACAGLNRLGLQSEISSPIEIDDMLPALAQGAIGIEVREDNILLRDALSLVNHADTATAVACERGFLAELDGSCKTPIAGYARVVDGRVQFRGETLTPDGKQVFAAERAGAIAEAAAMGRDAGLEVKAKGGQMVV